MKIKKFLALALAMCMIFSMTTVAFAADGSSSDPYLYQGDSISVTIPAGETIYYIFSDTVAQQINGATLEVSGSWDVSVQYGRQVLIPMANGKIQVTLNAMGTTFGLVNSNTEESITVNVNLSMGEAGDSMDNPEVIESIGQLAIGSDVELSEANLMNNESNAHYYKYVVEEDGQYVFSVMNQMGSAVVNLVVNHGILQYSTYGDEIDEIVVDAKADDEILIFVATVNEGTPICPAERVIWGCEFMEQGVEENPETITQIGGFSLSITEFSSKTYYYEYIVPADGTLSFYENKWSVSEGVKGDVYVTVNDAADDYQLSVDGEEDEYGDVVLSIDVKAEDELVIKVVYNSTDITEAGEYTYAWVCEGEFVQGTEPNPIMHEELTETITIKPNSSIWYTGRFDGSILFIEDAPEGLSVNFNKWPYTAEDGIIEVDVTMPVGSYEAPKFEYINDSDEEITFEVSFVYPEGTEQNPEEIELGDKEVNIPSNNGEYFLVYEALVDGKITIVVNCEEGWFYSMRGDVASTGEHYSDGFENEDGTIILTDSIVVKKGELVKIILRGYDPEDPWANNGTPEANFNITLSYESYVVEDDTITDDSEIEEIGKGSSIVIDENNEDEVVELEDATLEVTPTRKPQYVLIDSLAATALKDKVYQMLDLDVVDSMGYSMNWLLEGDVLEKITVTVAVPEALDYAEKIEVFWLDEENNKLVSIAKDVAVVDGKVTFDAKHFSTYVFAAEPKAEENPPVDNPPVENPPVVNPDKTGDMAPVAMLLVVAVAAAVVVLKKRETTEN